MSSFSSAYVQLVYSEKLLHLLGGRPNPGRRVLTPDLPQAESGVLTPTEFVSLLIPESPELQENWLRAPRPRPYGRIPLVEFQQMVEPPETAELNEAVPVAIAEVAESEAQVVENATLKETNASLVTAKTKLKIEVAQLKEKLRSCKSNGTSRAVCLTYC